jgi:excisionase family DNA binding protein
MKEVIVMQSLVKRHTYSVREVAELLGVSAKTVRREVRRGSIPVIRVGRRVLIPRFIVDKRLVQE